LITGRNQVRENPPQALGNYADTHAPVPNTRPPPTEDDPDAEENAMAAEMERELQADALPEIKDPDSKPAAS
jgi:hypothetical protein